MRDGRASLTAQIVAACRGAGRGAVDPVASDLLPLPLARALAVAAPLPPSAVAALTFGLSDHLALRTRAIDEALGDALAGPRAPSQLVVLGAGLDARAYRLASLAEVTVFEVDHPASQADKRARLGDRLPCAKEVRFLGVDFERDRLDDALRAGGHRDDAPTFWIWEGVTMYLHLPAVRATLEVIGRRSAPGSRAAITYATPDMTPLGGLAGLVALRAFRALGEPLHGLLAPRQMHAELEAVAFAVRDDASMRDLARRYTYPRAALLLAQERVVVAERR